MPLEDQLKNRRSRTNSGEPNPVDIHVGVRMRLRRTLLGLSQEKLGYMLGLTFQQVQKYERGTNRISASRLFEISAALSVPVAYFFQDMPEDIAQQSPRQIHLGSTGDIALGQADPMTRRETLELVRAYYRIGNPLIRRHILELTQSLGTTF